MSYSLAFLQVNTIKELFINALIIFGIYFLFSISFYFRLSLQNKIMIEVDLQLKKKINHWLSHKNYEEFHKRADDDYVSLYINDVEKVTELIVRKYFSITEKVSLAIFVLIMLLRIHLSMALLALFSLVVMYYVPQLFQNRLTRFNIEDSSIKSMYLSKVKEYFAGFDVFYENKAQSIFNKKLREKMMDRALFYENKGNFEAVVSGSLTFINSFTMVLALAVISYFVIQGKLGVGNFLAVMSLFPSFGTSILQIFSEKTFYQTGQELFKERFGDVLYEKNNEADRWSKFQKYKIASIKLSEISIKYGNKKIQYPRHITFNSGKKYRILGENASGKSTLLRIIIGEITQHAGKILVNNHLEGIQLLDNIAFVNQTTVLFNETVRENIDIFEQYSDSTILEIMANLDLTLNLDLIIENNGRNISGGQRQKIALARAIIRQKKIIILDEATSNIDRFSAEKIYHYIFDIFETVIIVDHNLPPIIDDKIDEKLVI